MEYEIYEAVPFLKQARKIDRMISNKIAEKEMWQAMARRTGAYSTGDRVQSAGGQQKMAEKIDRYVDIEREIDEAIAELKAVKQDIHNVIEQLPADEYDLLHKIYILGHELYEVPDMMDRSYAWCKLTHSRAKRHVQDILDARKVSLL